MRAGAFHGDAHHRSHRRGGRRARALERLPLRGSVAFHAPHPAGSSLSLSLLLRGDRAATRWFGKGTSVGAPIDFVMAPSQAAARLTNSGPRRKPLDHRNYRRSLIPPSSQTATAEISVYGNVWRREFQRVRN